MDVDPDPLPEDPPPELPDGDGLRAAGGVDTGVVWAGVVTAVPDAGAVDGAAGCEAAAWRCSW